jgi:hypothetical protein
VRDLVRALDDAVENNRIAAADAPTPGGLQPDQIVVLRNRLFMLGYLDHDSERTAFDADLETALRTFDAEAGLCDHDVRASWNALDELVSFERAVAIDRWFDGERACAALRRAAHLRLFSLGLAALGPRPRDTGDDLQRGVDGFARILRLFDPGDARPAAIDKPLLERLFDHDDWVDRFARFGEAVRFTQPPDAGNRESVRNRERVTNFVLAVARIELWLHGYASLPRPRVAGDVGATSAAVGAALVDFWADQPDEARPPTNQRDRVDGRFFAQLHALAGAAVAVSDDAIVERLEQDRDLQDRVAHEATSLGARIWDGLARATRWIGALFRRAATGIRQLARNLARLLSAGAQRAWCVLRNSVRAVVETISFAVNATMRGSDPLSLVVRHDGDFDLILVVNPQYDRTRLRAVVSLLTLRAELAEVGLRIIVYVERLLRDALKTVSLGWLALMLVLFRAAHTILALARESDVAGRLLGEIDRL